MHLAFIGKIHIGFVENFDCRPHARAGSCIEIAKLRVRAQGDVRFQPKAADMSRSADGDLRDFLGGRFGMNMGVGDKKRIIGEHNRQATHRFQPILAQNIGNMAQVPKILAEGAAYHRIGLAAMHHGCGDHGGVGSDNGARQRRRDAPPLHDRMIGFPIIAVAFVVLWIDKFKILVRFD